MNKEKIILLKLIIIIILLKLENELLTKINIIQRF